jgi:hypothetical protein
LLKEWFKPLNDDKKTVKRKKNTVRQLFHPFILQKSKQALWQNILKG